MDALPYYKWFWIDFRANRKVQRMSWQARGLYRELLDEFWSEGILPNDTVQLAEICGLDHTTFLMYWPEIQRCWEVTDEGLINAKMDAQRTEVDTARAAKARAGAKGGRSNNSSNRDKQMQADDKQMLAQPDIAEHEQSISKSKAEKPAASGFVLPDWVDSEAWQGFEEMRKKERHPLTERARKLAITDLEKLRASGSDPTEVLNQSTLKAWRGLFAVNRNGQYRPSSKPDDTLQQIRARNAKAAAEVNLAN